MNSHGYTEYLTDICCAKVKGISDRIGDTHTQSKPTVQTQRIPQYQNNKSYSNNPPANTNNNAPRYGNAPRQERTPQNYPGSGRSTSPSFAQVNMLKKLGYTDEQLSVMTKVEATEIIRDYQVSTGYQNREHDIPDYNQY